MAMTKAEKAEMEELRTRLALHWTPGVEPDLPIPQFGRETQGWYFNEHSKLVYEAWSGSTLNGRGKLPKSPEEMHQRIASRGGMALYSTRERALRALRSVLAWRAARDLRAIDLLIEQEPTK